MSAAAVERLRELHRAHVRAWQDRDLEALGRLYADDSLIFDTYPPPVYEGWAAFRSRIAPVLERYRQLRIRTHEQRIQVHGEVGWIASRYVLEARVDGAPYRSTGRWTEIYRKGTDGWRLVHLHSSVDPERGPGASSTGR